MNYPKCKPLEQVASVDWATFTASSSDGQRTLYDAYNAMSPHSDDCTERPWSWYGYEGLHVQGLACGSRDDGTILRASGHWADDIIWILPLTREIRPSRIDLAVTVRLDDDQPDLARKVYLNKRAYAGGRKRLPGFTLYENDENGGQTLYAGSRKSARMLRLYDKHRESGQEQWRNCWRYEVELKNGNKSPWARSYWEGIVDGRWSLSDTQAIVHQHSEELCVPALFPPSGGNQMVLTRARATSTEGTLEWFRAQVSPVAARLIEAGRIEDVLHSLFPAHSIAYQVASRAKSVLLSDVEWGIDSQIGTHNRVYKNEYTEQ